MTFAIRPYHPSDLYSLYHICLLTSDNGKDGSHLYGDPEVMGHYYAAPYAVIEPELAFVLTHKGTPCGYTLGARNSVTFRDRCNVEWFPPLRVRYPMPDDTDESADAGMIRLIHRGFGVNEPVHEIFPAHLHIDLLPVGQGQGMGRRMMDTLLDKMRALGVPGVHLGAAKANQRAVRFYANYGFEVLRESDAAYNFGMILK
jgi:ribosomal protein S18 acetylase RimI-like enzyme